MVIGSRRWKSSILSAKIRSRADCGINHELPRSNIRAKLNKNTKSINFPKYHLKIIPIELKDNVKNRFVGSSLIDQERGELWIETWDIIREETKKTLSAAKKKEKPHWATDKTLQADKDKQEAKAGTFPCYPLSVKVIQAQHICSRDLLSSSDCYVSLWLPSASNKQVVTKTISNTPNPVWNESFHFVIQSQSKNVLELKLYDQDVVTKDDLLFTVNYDIAKVRPGETIQENFILNEQGPESLEVEFKMESTCCGLEQIITNGILMSREVSCLEVQIDKGKNEDCLKKHKNIELRVDESFEETQKITQDADNFQFHYAKNWEPKLKAKLKPSSSMEKGTMRNLYEEPDWSQKDLIGQIRKAQECILRSKSSAFSLVALQFYNEELRRRAQEGHSISFTDVWSLIIDHMFHDKESDSKLSDQQLSVNQGQNPLPIYLALTVKEDTQTTSEFKEWCEFSPYEVGFSKYGAFIRSEDFGSEFYMGRLMKKKPESRICYLEGIWSNIFSLNLVDFWNLYKLWQWPFSSQEKDDNTGDTSKTQVSEYHTACFTPPKDISSIINGVLTHRLIEEEKPNFLRGLQLHNDYYQNKTFSMWQDSHLDQHPNYLTPLEKELCLVDPGYFINTSCPPLLRKERNVDVIISLDYNLLETRFNSLEQMSKYCLDQEIPFPKIVLTEEDRKNPKECYLFEDKENPEAPIILHFPLVNDSFRDYKKPGIKRTTAEMTKGEVELNSLLSPYKMTDLTYTEDEFNTLLNLCDYNIQNNRVLILQALWTAIERRNVSRL
ncbi:cytosolic phospholipase A2 delta-like [Sceloporus undulatus]|uniref:cytosolic phospholipase A2 delta-like n=1 Tax=Sceloporus undulatus TaxID=8520 RepID=UPI001C4B249D|nr:cytosolic phospholipase A2 delta-like [Sceloporus undulatus]